MSRHDGEGEVGSSAPMRAVRRRSRVGISADAARLFLRLRPRWCGSMARRGDWKRGWAGVLRRSPAEAVALRSARDSRSRRPRPPNLCVLDEVASSLSPGAAIRGRSSASRRSRRLRQFRIFVARRRHPGRRRTGSGRPFDPRRRRRSIPRTMLLCASGSAPPRSRPVLPGGRRQRRRAALLHEEYHEPLCPPAGTALSRQPPGSRSLALMAARSARPVHGARGRLHRGRRPAPPREDLGVIAGPSSCRARSCHAPILADPRPRTEGPPYLAVNP